MNNEIEAQFLDINKSAIRKQLKAIGAKLIKPEILMRRTVFFTGEHSFARVRDEGDKIVMTYKNVSDDNSILGTKEVNVIVNDYGIAEDVELSGALSISYNDSLTVSSSHTENIAEEL